MRRAAAVPALCFFLLAVLSAPAFPAEPGKGAPDPIADTLLSGTVGTGWGDAASTAGDVNGDGYSDLLIGAREYGSGQFVEGIVYLHYGSAEGVSTTPGWSYESNLNFAQLGWSVAPAGDTNGDGYDDFVVGAPGVSNGHTNEGRIYVFVGGPAGPSLLTTFELNEEDARFGHAVAWAGDVNGDGYDDVLAGAPEWGGFGSPFFIPVQGAAALYYGGLGGPTAAGRWGPTGGQTASEFGYAVAGVGDVNDDGFADVLVGAPGWDAGSLDTNQGTVRLYLGSSSGLSGTADWSRPGPLAGAEMGRSVSYAGDFNGDDLADVLLGSPGISRIEFHRGHPTLNLVFDGAKSRSTGDFGSALGGIGDYDGDGFSDLIAGGGQDEAVLLFEGTAGGPQESLFLNGGTLYGSVVTSAGDVNGDGLSDWLITDPLANGGAGRIHVFHGASHDLDSSSADFIVNGSIAGAKFGHGVAALGDQDRDGYDEFVVGIPYGGSGDEGQVRRHRGNSGGGVQISWTLEGEHPGGEFGYAVAAAGDVNGDGFEDLLVGEPGFDTIHVYHGPLDLAPSSADFSHTYSVTGSRFGAAVDGAGDLNADGYADIVVGAPSYDGDGVDIGAMFVFYGSPQGITGYGAEGRTNFEDGMQFGFAVAGVGDGDGDGFDDVAIGAPAYDLGLVDRGGLFVYFGGADGLRSIPFGTSGPESGDALGTSVAAAGDVDGDGVADMIVGIPGRDRSGNADTGEAWILMGSATAAVPYLTRHILPPPTESGGERFGAAVGSAGDRGGKGSTDVAVASTRLSGQGARVDFFDVREGSPHHLQFKLASDVADEPRLALLGDLDGDGFPEMGLGLPHAQGAQEGAVWLLSAHVSEASHVPIRRPELRKLDDSPVAWRGLVPDGGDLEFASDAWMPNGRARLRLEWQFAPGTQTFSGIGTGPWEPTVPSGGLTTPLVAPVATPLAFGSAYRWRVRVASSVPFHPKGRWFSHARGSSSLYGLRVVDTVTAVVDETPPGPGAVSRLSPPRPNPFNPSTTLAFTLERAARVSLRIFDARGRLVTVLQQGDLPAGRHEVRWEGRDESGRRVGSATYFAVLDSDLGREGTKLTLVK